MKLIWLAILLYSLSGCAQRMYTWGEYETHLSNYYDNPAVKDEFVAGLKSIIEYAELSKEKVPPGIYAEYGYALYETGKAIDAIMFYKKEADSWPESKMLMSKMILLAEKKELKTSAPLSVTEKK